jgi:hypothetical protein
MNSQASANFHPTPGVGGPDQSLLIYPKYEIVRCNVLPPSYKATLASSTETENKMKGRLLLDVVVGKSTAVLELLASKDEALLVRRDALLVLDLGLDVVNGI